MTAGFMEVTPEELRATADGLNDKLSGATKLFSESPKVQGCIESLRSRSVTEKKTDTVRDIQKKTTESDWQQTDGDVREC
jgi:hypothetical protein